MGCDIHMVLERRDTARNKWVGINDFAYPGYLGKPECPLTYYANYKDGEDPVKGIWLVWKVRQRNYDLFAELANVRNYDRKNVHAAKGMPEDASDLAWLNYDYWGADGHSHSWHTLKEFLACYLRATEKYADAVASKLEGEDPYKKLAKELFGVDYEEDDYLDQYRVVFWFDN